MAKPKIRFKGYTNDWEQRKLGDYNDLMTGYPFESDKFSEDGIKLVRGMNVKRGYLDFSEDICVKWNSCVGLENFLLKDGDILIQMDGALIGKSYAKIKENQLPALLVQRVTRARTNNKFASQDFMYQTIQRDFLRYIGMNKTETAVPHLSLNDIRNFKIMVPCLAEQKKIGDYFENLDHLITLHQRKCDQAKKLKKYMLQKMFPKNNKSVPEIRFEGFSNDWEQRKWMNSVDISTEMVDPASGEYDDMPHIAPGNIESFTGRILDNVRTVKEEQLISGKFRFRPDDVVYGKINPQLGKYFYSSVDGLTSADAYVFKGKNGITQKFLFSVLQTSDFFKYSVSVSKRSGMPKINRDELNAYAFLAPSEEEQDKIGTFLLKIDNLITLHQKKCDQLKNLKKFMLQNMFV